MKDSPGMFVDGRVVGFQIGNVREVVTPAGRRVVLKVCGGGGGGAISSALRGSGLVPCLS